MQEYLKSQFLTTEWTNILGSDGGESDRPGKALVKLCENYRYPVYAFIRKRCSNVEEARDLTQGFFEFLVDKKIYRSATPERGRFRTFLLAAVRNFLANEIRDAHRQKRGGDAQHWQVDALVTDAQYASELSNVVPDTLFDREWANTVFDRVWELLQTEYDQIHQRARFDLLRPSLMAPEDSLPYADLGNQLGMSEGGVKSAVFRLRRRFRELFRATVAQLVENPNDVDEEIRYLMLVIARSDS